jgi:hypothetical protein
MTAEFDNRRPQSAYRIGAGVRMETVIRGNVTELFHGREGRTRTCLVKE